MKKLIAVLLICTISFGAFAQDKIAKIDDITADQLVGVFWNPTL